MHPCRVFLIGTDDVLWLGLDAAVRSLDWVHVAGSICSPDSTIVCADVEEVDVVFLHVEIPMSRLAQIVQTIARAWPGSKVIIVAHDFFPPILDVLSSVSVQGILLWQDVSVPTLQQCLHALTASDVIIASRSVPSKVIPLLHRSPPPAGAPVPALTSDEQDLLYLLVQGLTQKQIAQATDSSVRTVKRRVAALAKKFGAASAFTLGFHAGAMGLVASPS
jgi:DNA-binding NarL/FixJ family response regulator